jgi:S-adenosylmethionine:tRNA ribosyltransferase-isomerase
MVENFEKILGLYDYDLPAELIATEPAHPRDAARLMVYDRQTGKISEDIFRNIGKYLPPKSVLVFNETKVIPARLPVRKTTGGKVKILFVGVERGSVKVMSPKPLREGEKLSFASDKYFTVRKNDGKFWLLRPSFHIKDIYKILDKFGEMPIPPYIKNSPLTKSELKKEYQTVFARTRGSVAAPTAALHFTRRLLAEIRQAGHQIIFITLHVNLGTFSPLTEENFRTGRLHSEYYEITPLAARKLNVAKARGQKIIAVGTTSLRALESAVRNGVLKRLSGATSLFIREDHTPPIRPNEGYSKFTFVNGLITNFHVPRSSLLMLVSALAGREKVLALYHRAIARKFRFFSFGDGMLIL